MSKSYLTIINVLYISFSTKLLKARKKSENNTQESELQYKIVLGINTLILMIYLWQVLMMRSFNMHDQRTNEIRKMQIVRNNQEGNGVI